MPRIVPSKGSALVIAHQSLNLLRSRWLRHVNRAWGAAQRHPLQWGQIKDVLTILMLARLEKGFQTDYQRWFIKVDRNLRIFQAGYTMAGIEGGKGGHGVGLCRWSVGHCSRLRRPIVSNDHQSHQSNLQVEIEIKIITNHPYGRKALSRPSQGRKPGDRLDFGRQPSKKPGSQTGP